MSTMTMPNIAQLLEAKQYALENEEGYVQVFADFKRLIDWLTEQQAEIKDLAILEASKHPEKQFNVFGAKIQYREGAGRWDFKNLPDWNDKKKELETIEDKHKAAYQAWQRGGMYVDEETGEQIQPAAYIAGSPTISVTLFKTKD